MINYTILGLLFFIDFHLWFEFFAAAMAQFIPLTNYYHITSLSSLVLDY